MAKNRQLKLKPTKTDLQKVLRLCYFIFAISLLSCGNDKNNSSKDKTSIQDKETSEKPQDQTTSGNPKEEKEDIKTILCFGDSITAGYGLENKTDAFPALLQQKIDSLNLNYEVVNSGLSGETTAGGKRRIDWILNQDINVFILELGANDGLRGVPLSETRINLQAIISRVKKVSPQTKIILAGMQLPPNMGEDYTNQFKKIYTDLAQQNDIAFIPFILKDVGGIAKFNQSDGIHPTAKGHQIIANTVWETLKPLLD